ncbi:MAG: 2-oxoglutarate dehydrogenase E1 subunit family protein, partial [Brevundimonas sp.]|uniref:2-oxoglutarate dehydrogenase E1 subunit family protein n=1 Tax=Brevundimonas sp. TaxID=1871086 RepID=UPI004033F032
MARQDQANDRASLTSFLYGGNAAYIDELYASWQDNPRSDEPEWREFFAELKDDAEAVKKGAA